MSQRPHTSAELRGQLYAYQRRLNQHQAAMAAITHGQIRAVPLSPREVKDLVRQIENLKTAIILTEAQETLP